MSSSAPGSTSSSARPSLSALVQYFVFALVAYILAGAPALDSVLDLLGVESSASPSTTSSSSSSWRSGTQANWSRAEQHGQERIESLIHPDPKLECPAHGYKTYVLRRDPLVVYVEGFLSEEERRVVVGVSEPNYTPSTLWTANKESYNPSIRHSQKSPLPASHPTIACIAERARAFQGWRPYLFVEKLWAQRYGVGGHYRWHYDFGFSSAGNGGGNGKGRERETRIQRGRVSTFMVYVEANCTGGGTNFPRIEPPADRSWCRFIECEDGGDGDDVSLDVEGNALHGTTFKPIPGNAVFWENLRDDGSGYEETWHAGLPVRSGVKIGLNVWSWVQEGYTAVFGDGDRDGEEGGVVEAGSEAGGGSVDEV